MMILFIFRFVFRQRKVWVYWKSWVRNSTHCFWDYLHVLTLLLFALFLCNFIGIPAIACINKIDLPSVTKDADKYGYYITAYSNLHTK